MLLHLNPKGFDESTVLNARGASCFATAAIKAKIQVPFHGLGQFKSPVRDSAHQINPAARTVILVARFQVGRASGSAQTAMDTVEKTLVVDPAADPWFRRSDRCVRKYGKQRRFGRRGREFSHSGRISTARHSSGDGRTDRTRIVAPTCGDNRASHGSQVVFVASHAARAAIIATLEGLIVPMMSLTESHPSSSRIESNSVTRFEASVGL